jgi:hypothetical protein
MDLSYILSGAADPAGLSRAGKLVLLMRRMNYRKIDMG